MSARHCDPEFLAAVRRNDHRAIQRARQETRQKLRQSYRSELETALNEVGRSYDRRDGTRVNPEQVRA